MSRVPSDPRTTIFVVRHGRTALNTQGRFRGRQDPPLDETGVEEARATAHMLGGRPIVAIATSPLTRARQTAEAIGEVVGCVPSVAAGLIDLDHGAWEGLTAQEAETIDADAYARFRSDPRASTPPGGEPLAEVERRIGSVLDALADGHPGAALVAVSHEIPIRLLLSGSLGIEGPDVWTFPLPTASVWTLVRTEGSTWTIVDPPRTNQQSSKE